MEQQTHKQGDEGHRSRVLGVVLRLRGYILGLIGFGVLTTSYFLEAQHQTAPALWNSPLVIGLGRSAGAAVMVFGILTVLVEFPSTVGYVQDQLLASLKQYEPNFTGIAQDIANRCIADDLSDIDVVRTLKEEDPERFKQLHFNVLRIAHDQDFRNDGRFAQILTEQIEPLLGFAHYNDMSVHITNEIVQEGDLCYIRSHRTYTSTVHSRNAVDGVWLGFTKEIRPIPGVDNSKLYVLNRFEVRGEDFSEQVVPKMDQHRLSAQLWHETSVARDEEFSFVRDETLLIPISDIFTWSVQPGKSLRNLELMCSFDADVSPKVTCHGFKHAFSKWEKPRGCGFTFRGWMLPYQGFVVSWDDPFPICRAEPVATAEESLKPAV